MARDVDFNVTASDKTGAALSSAERRVKATQDRMRKQAEDTFGGVGKGLLRSIVAVSPGMARAVTRGLTAGAEAAAPVLGAVAVAAAPMIAATLSAAVVGGAGIGGVVGGVALAARDPRVAAAGTALGERMMGTLTDAARPFVDTTLDAIDRVEKGFAEVEGNLRSILARSAQFVGPLTDGAISFGQAMVRAWDVIIQKAGPTINAIRDGMKQTGDALAGFLTTVAGDGQAAAAAMRNLFDMVSGLLAVLGPTIAALSKVYEWLDRIGAAGGLLQTIANVAGLSRGTGELTAATRQTVSAFTDATAASVGYAGGLDASAAAARTNITEQSSLFGATTNAAKSFREAKKAVEEHGKGMKLNTETGIANRTTLKGLADDLMAQYDAYVEVYGAGNNANIMMGKNRQAFIEVATKATGSAAAANKLADELLGVPSIKPKVELLDKATGKINNVINRLAAVRSKTVTLNVAVRQSADAAALRKQDQTRASAARYDYAAGAAGNHRTGGPTPVAVTSNVNVMLDGAPFAAQTTRIVNDTTQRERWRQRVGLR